MNLGGDILGAGQHGELLGYRSDKFPKVRGLQIEVPIAGFQLGKVEQRIQELEERLAALPGPVKIVK